jgi:hypothetical protein
MIYGYTRKWLLLLSAKKVIDRSRHDRANPRAEGSTFSACAASLDLETEFGA